MCLQCDVDAEGSPPYERTMSSDVGDFDQALSCEPSLGWELVHATIPQGYDPENTGDFPQWLFSLIGLRLRDGFLPDPEIPAVIEGRN